MMRTTQKHFALLLASVVFLISNFVSASFAQGTAFSFQGRLTDAGAPANGTYDLRFTLYDSASENNAVGGPLTNSATAVSNGLFIVTLDFGTGTFNGTQRWLEIAVRTNGAAGFTTLNNLQPITATPYAILANSASNLLGNLPTAQLNGTVSLAQLPVSVVTNNNTAGVTLNGTFTGNGAGLTTLPANVALLNSNQTFSGTNQFTQPVVIVSSAPVLKIFGPGGEGTHATLDLSTYDPGTNAPSARIQTTDDNWSSDWDFYGKQPGANTNPLVSLMHLANNGYVGMGTTSPQTPLHVANSSSVVALLDSSNVNGTALDLRNTAPGGTNWVIYSAGSSLTFLTQPGVTSTAGSITAVMTSSGDFLVKSNVLMNSGYAAGAPEALRIIRGIINPIGTPAAGTGFNVSHTGNTGSYTITFNTPFSGLPTVTASGVHAPVLVGGALNGGAVTIQTTFGANQDDTFSFIAVGPP